MISDTPETDAQFGSLARHPDNVGVWMELALPRRLERERNSARKSIMQWIEAWEKYGDGASLMHPRLTMAITAARKSLENVKEHATPLAGASVETGVEVHITGDVADSAASGGCCVSTCSGSSILGGRAGHQVDQTQRAPKPNPAAASEASSTQERSYTTPTGRKEDPAEEILPRVHQESQSDPESTEASRHTRRSECTQNGSSGSEMPLASSDTKERIKPSPLPGHGYTMESSDQKRPPSTDHSPDETQRPHSLVVEGASYWPTRVSEYYHEPLRIEEVAEMREKFSPNVKVVAPPPLKSNCAETGKLMGGCSPTSC